jgi:IS4 transposase
VIRQHGNTPYKPLTEIKFVGRSATGRFSEQTVCLTSPAGETSSARRLVVELEKPTRNGDRMVVILTNLSEEVADALAVSDLYRNRWKIETAFQKLEKHSSCKFSRDSKLEYTDKRDSFLLLENADAYH